MPTRTYKNNPGDDDWMADAACAGTGATSDWVPTHVNDDTRKLVQVYCVECPVREVCLKYGNKTRSSGIWGGHWLVFGQATKNENRSLMYGRRYNREMNKKEV